MEIPYRSFVSSHPFQFLIGPQKRPFYVHADLVIQHSASLAALVDGPMREASERCATIEDIDEDTFINLVEFLYTGDYTVPDPEDSTSEDQQEENAAEWHKKLFGVKRKSLSNNSEPTKKNGRRDKIGPENLDPWHEEMVLKKKDFSKDARNQSKRLRDLAWAAFRDQAQDLTDAKFRPEWQPRWNLEDGSENHTRVFLCHAQLYVFSDRYSINDLAELSVQKLCLTLSEFRSYKKSIPDVVALVRYTYENTLDHDEGIDKLRSLVVDYVVCHFEDVVKNRDFQDMLQEPGALAKDLAWKTLQRLD